MEIFRSHQALAGLLVLTLSCGVHYATPRRVTRDARFGRLAGAAAVPQRATLCGHWITAMRTRDRSAERHTSFPETDPAHSCFVPVNYGDAGITIGASPPGCAYPAHGQVVQLEQLARQLDAMRAESVASHEQSGDSPEHLLPCGITPRHRDATLAHNVRVLQRVATRLRADPAVTYPYAAVITFGYGWPDQAQTSIADWLPDQSCGRLSQQDIDRMGPMVLRTRRVAEALRAGIAPVAIVSGGTEHSRMVEAFAMLFLLRCAFGVPRDQVLLEPCAEHTHTNIRNGGRWLVAMGARTGYLVTDDGIQSDYLEERSGFEPLGASLDQRSLRDWGYVLGSWRRAARGPNVGHWFTPYRFWAEPRDGAGSLTCLDVASD